MSTKAIKRISKPKAVSFLSSSSIGGKVLEIAGHSYMVSAPSFFTQLEIQQKGTEIWKRRFPKKQFKTEEFGNWMQVNNFDPDVLNLTMDVIFKPVGNSPMISVLLANSLPSYEEQAQLMLHMDFFTKSYKNIIEKRIK